jgi:hypothetical protein
LFLYFEAGSSTDGPAFLLWSLSFFVGFSAIKFEVVERCFAGVFADCVVQRGGKSW